MIIHVVEQGETIGSIAKEYGISTQRIISDNGLAGLDRLVPGQALLILQPDTVYTVAEGDTIYSVSNKYGITTDQLIQRNPSLALSNTITPGEMLTINYIDQTNIPINIYGFLYPYIKNQS